MSEFQLIIQSIMHKYKLGIPDFIKTGATVYFIFISDDQNLTKILKMGTVVKEDMRCFMIQSDQLYRIPKALTFLSQKRAKEVMDKISIDELRIIL